MIGNRLKYLSKKIAIFLIFALSINCLAAAVSDNDGSAFITKAEFDSLKSNFQAQIDGYNSSIDAKIDEAIAGYLNGLKISTKEILTDYVANAYKKDAKNVTFSNWNATPSCSGRSAHDIESRVFVSYSNGPVAENPYSDKYYGWTILKNTNTWVRSNYLIKYPKNTPDTNEEYHDYMYWGYFNDDKDTSKGWYLYDAYMHRAKFTVSSEAAPFDNTSMKKPYTFNSLTFTADYSSRTMAGKVSTDKTWKIAETTTINIPLWIYHEWEYETLKITGTTTKQSISTGYSKEKEKEGTKQEWLTDMNGSYINSQEVKMTLFEKRDEYPDNPASQFPDGTSNQVYTITVQEQDAKTGTDGGQVGINIAWWKGTTKLSHQATNNVNCQVKYRKQKNYTVDLNKLTSNYWTTIRNGEPHYCYNGVLLARRLKDKGEVAFSFNVSLPDDKGSCTYTYAISDKPFKNETISQNYIETIDGKSYNHILKYETNKKLGDLEIKIKKEKILDKLNGDALYIKISPDDPKKRIQLISNNNPIFTKDND